MDLPTYTNIWRIEKRLYKLYDFNLPMPLPMVQIGVFIGVLIPWVVLLRLVQVPFSSPWHVFYLVPPGLVTYLATRPVLEGKRLTELLLAQLRYLTEPRTWCRLTPAYEPERARIDATVWHRVSHPPTTPARHARGRVRAPAVGRPTRIDRVASVVASRPESAPAAPQAIAAPGPSRVQQPAADSAATAGQRAGSRETPAQANGAASTSSPSPGRPQRTAVHGQANSGAAAPAVSATGAPPPHTTAAPNPPARGSAPPVTGEPAEGFRPSWRRLSLAMRGAPAPDAIERSPAGELTARIAAPLDGSRRLVVLGCAGGAGQTTTALMLGHSLARHRRDRCVAVDANVGPWSLARRSRMETPETLASLLGGIDSIRGYLALRAYTSQAGSGLEVIASDEDAAILTSFREHDFGSAAAVLGRYYTVTLFDPAEPIAPRLLPLADQLVLVAPAGAGAVPAVENTLEWLGRRGYAGLASGAVLVINGMTKSGAAAAEREATSVAGRCRSVVRVPWDGRLNPGGGAPAEPDTLHQATRDAYLRLATSLVEGFSRVPDDERQEVSR